MGIVTVFIDFPTATIVWAVWSVIYQQLENNVIQPRIQSKAVQLEPFIVLVCVLFGAALFGVMGALLAIPAGATISVAIREYGRYQRIRRGEEPDSGEVEEQVHPLDKPTDPPPPSEPSTA